MASSAINVEGISKRYRLGETRRTTLVEQIGASLRSRRGKTDEGEEFWALRDVSLDVDAGEVVGLIGANGAGKSTLLKVLARVTYPTEGTATLNGRVGTLLEVGTGMHPELSGRENVFLSGAILGMGRREVAAKFDQIVDFAGVEEFIDTPVKRYSSGMYVRLAFAVAAFLEPEILLVDEVLAVGDAEFQRRCLGRMQDVVDEGRTIVFVSHNLSAVQRLCEKSFWIHHGRVEAAGPTEEVIAAYLSGAGSQGSGGEVEIDPDAARVGSGEVLLRSASLSGASGTPVEQLALGERMVVRVTFEALEPIDDAVVEIGITSGEGLRVVMAQSIDRDAQLYRLAPGLCELQADLDMSLLPGGYHVDIAIHRLAGATLDLVERALTFSVHNSPVDGSYRYPWNIVRGSVRPPSRWKASGAARAGERAR